VKLAREKWREELKTLDAKQYLFVDETGAKTNMTRRYGRAPVGERVRDHTPAGNWTTTTLLSAVRDGGPVAPLLIEGATDAAVFTTWVEQCLAPTLRQGDTVVMDNLSSHKAAAVAELIAARGAKLRYLPPYSPDLNPIEKMWSKVKTLLRGAKARTAETLSQAVADALSAVTKSDVQGWYQSCGYTI
jgi:transposase